MKKAALPILALAALLLGGCSGEPPVTKADEEAFKHPNRSLPTGFTAGPTHGGTPPPAAAGAAPPTAGG